MLTKVEVISAQGETLSLPLTDLGSGYVIDTIEGLDPVKATIVSSPFAQVDGSQYQSSRRENRNVVMKLDLEPDYASTSVEALRKKLYDFFMPKASVVLNFYINNVHFATINGRVESCDIPLFAKEPKATISIICFKPDFIGVSSIIVPGSTVSDNTAMEIEYPGSVETGAVFKLAVDRTISEFMIYNQTLSGELYTMEFAAALSAGDVLEISTVSGAKGVWFTRAGAKTPIPYAISPVSTYFKLHPKTNFFRVQAAGAAIPYTIEYTPRYGGL